MVGKPFKPKATTSVCQSCHMLYSVFGKNFRFQPSMYITLKTRMISLNRKIKQRRTIRTWNPEKNTKNRNMARRVQYFSKIISTKRQKDKNEGRRIGTESFHNWQLYANTSYVLFGFGKCFRLHPRFTPHWSLKRYPRIKRTSSEERKDKKSQTIY